MQTIDVNGTTIAFHDEGPRDAPALLFAHSLFFDSDMFASQAEHFSSTCRVVRYDHRGQGASALAPREQLDMDTLSEDAAALIEALDLQRTTIVGNSMGGFVALRLAARRPDLVVSAVVAGSSADAEERKDEFGPLVDAMAVGGVEPVLDIVTHIMLGDTSLGGARTELLRDTRERLGRLGPSIADAAWQVVNRRSVLDELAAITVPVLVLAGAEDHAYPPPKSEQIGLLVDGSTVVTLDGVGHSVLLEDPSAANEHIARHLGGLLATA